MPIYASMKSVAAYVPNHCIPNSFFTNFLETSDEWIIQRTGIKTRYFAPSHIKSSDLGVEAAKVALRRANLEAKDIDVLLCASISPDFFGMPSTACIIASKLGISDVPAFDIVAACSGFIYCLSVAKSYIESGLYRNVLVIGAEKISTVLDFSDRSTCVLFGDGAGACVIGQSDEIGIKDVHISSNGNFSHLLYTPRNNNVPNHFQADIALLEGIIEDGQIDEQFVKMKGNEVFKVAVRTISKDARDILQRNHISSNELDFFIPHQANLRIIQAIASSLKLSNDKLILTVQQYGNTSAASIPMALDFGYTQGKFKNRDLLLLDAFGAGFTWGSALVYADFVT
ncbi:ketoacyl-ACP synthase III [Helicobacter aurati]|uniref:Beta-ketoacyl-[acyl-carrier-protein] synthase III n=1 Tax=Helicobacter aurati TaxID=137778 RepID=A0A3D8J7Y0_9HELI|nr:beta-ketoacyl-ACP synthase III [Helicobacter aurati]RDU73370.1 ketoacyl-ACP synthase III [Helicobacter aurati]